MSAYVDNRTPNILIIGKGLADELDDTSLAAEVEYSVNITKSNKKNFLSLHHSKIHSFWFANGLIFYKFKLKVSA